MAVVTGIISDIVYKNEDSGFTVLEIKDDDKSSVITAVGSMLFAVSGEKVEVEGQWTVHPDYGPQLKVNTYKSVKPSTIDGMEKYLASGLIRGVGPSTAKKLVERFGLDVLDIIQYSPEKLREIPGIGKAKVEMIASSFEEQKEIREVMLFFNTYGIGTAYAVRVYKLYGENTVEVIKENPYRLADEVVGIGFKTADKVATSLGISYESEYRTIAGVRYILYHETSNGNTYLPREILIEKAHQLLGTDKQAIDNAITKMAVDKKLVVESMGEDVCVYLAPFYYAEAGVCKKLIELSMTEIDSISHDVDKQIDKIQNDNGIILAKEQREAVKEAALNGVIIITGGPGTGKTTIINFIISMLEKNGLGYELAAPTGRAAKRMSEATGKDARTIHRLLEYAVTDDGARFLKNEEDPITADAVIIDEMSMVDILLMNNLLKALLPGERLIMVGDVDQLPSVGPGNVLRDLIDSKFIKVVELKTIFRQAQESMIVVNAHRINNGELPVLNVKNKDFFYDSADKPQDILNKLMNLLLKRLPAYGEYNPLSDIQILTPMRKGLTGVNNLNAEIQDRINPKTEEKCERKLGNVIFRVGDKIMQVKNNYKLKWETIIDDKIIENGEGVFNGDIGFVKAIDEEEQNLTVLFDDNRRVVYDFTQLNELEHAYAISIHKSQGSEFPVVVIPLAWGPPMLMTRNLLYTAVTRAREMVVIVGRNRTIISMVNNDHIMQRYSGLNNRFSGVLNIANQEL